MSRFAASAIVWGLFWFGSFAVLEFTPVFWHACPWTTLSSFAKGLEHRWIWVALLFLVGLTVLNVHIVGSFLPRLYREIAG